MNPTTVVSVVRSASSYLVRKGTRIMQSLETTSTTIPAIRDPVSMINCEPAAAALNLLKPFWIVIHSDDRGH